MINRKNMLEQRFEWFKPPLNSKSNGVLGRLIYKLRMFLDIQAGSIWRDLSKVLPDVRGNVLDVGCGAQIYRELFCANKANYIGLDTIQAKVNFGYESPDTRYYSGTIFPVDTGSIDFILCTEVLEHIQEPSWFIKEMARCLKENGTLLLTVPFAARWHFIPYDYFRYTPSGLFNLLNEAGFSDVKVYARGNSVTVAFYKMMAIMIPFLVSGGQRTIYSKMVIRTIGVLFLPIICLFAFVANISVNNSDSAEDCIGYTVIANLQNKSKENVENTQ
ncbi:MAG TPA: class I SAM-dependent methyltransferase [Aquella sp.]|nr:class I SAM-dependent methyltransferase [Aquella sp.]